MKLGTFVLGGLAGAAVVMMMRSRSWSAMSAGLGQMAKQRVNRLKDSAMAGLNVNFADSAAAAVGGQPSAGSRSSASRSATDLGDVKKLASQDPKVKHEINAILEENKQQKLEQQHHN